MSKKKFLSRILTALLLATLTIPASASDLSTSDINYVKDTSTRIEASCKLPEVVVHVDVPTTGTIYINPLEIPVEINGAFIGYQIMTNPMHIENKTEVPVIVSATVCGKVKEGSNMTLTSTSTLAQGSKKRAFIYFEIKAVDDPDNVEWDLPFDAQTKQSSFDAEKHLIVRTSQKTKKNIVTLGAAGEDGCYGAFRLTGDCAPTPKSPWTEEDGLDVTVAFTFKPTVLS